MLDDRAARVGRAHALVLEHTVRPTLEVLEERTAALLGHAVVVEPLARAIGNVDQVAREEHRVEPVHRLDDLLEVGRRHRHELMIGGQQDGQGPTGGRQRGEGERVALDPGAVRRDARHRVRHALAGFESRHRGLVTPDVPRRVALVDLTVLGLRSHPGLLVLGHAAQLHRLRLEVLPVGGDLVSGALELGEPDHAHVRLARQLQEGVGEEGGILRRAHQQQGEARHEQAPPQRPGVRHGLLRWTSERCPGGIGGSIKRRSRRPFPIRRARSRDLSRASDDGVRRHAA